MKIVQDELGKVKFYLDSNEADDDMEKLFDMLMNFVCEKAV